MRERLIRLVWIAVLYAGLCILPSCGTPTYYGTSGGYYSTGGWYDPYYHRPCCRGYHRPHYPHRPPGARPPGMRPPGTRPPVVRPPIARPPHGGHRPSIPSRPRPTPRPAGRR
jgi:hypothetical protein